MFLTGCHIEQLFITKVTVRLTNIFRKHFTARKRSLGQGNIFRSVCQEFCSWGGLPQCMLGYHIPLLGADPCGQAPPPPRAGRLPGQAPTQTRHHYTGAEPPPLQRSACWEIRSTSSRYASYWNAILFKYVLNFIFFCHMASRGSRDRHWTRRLISETT